MISKEKNQTKNTIQDLIKNIDRHLDNCAFCDVGSHDLYENEKLFLVHFLEGNSIILFSQVGLLFGKIEGAQDLLTDFSMHTLLKLEELGILRKTEHDICTTFFTDPLNVAEWKDFIYSQRIGEKT